MFVGPMPVMPSLWPMPPSRKSRPLRLIFSLTVNVTIDVATPFELTRSVTLSSIDAPSYCAATASTSARASTYFSSPTNVFALRLTKMFVSKKASGSSRTDSVMSTQLRQTSNLLLFCLSIMPDPPSAAK